jgi:DNA-binding protein
VKKTPNFYVFLGKKYLESHEEIELHALGNAVSTSVIAAENLVRN